MTRYDIFIGGYGCEVCWNKLTEEQYAFWSSVDKELLDKYVLGNGVFDDENEDEEKRYNDFVNNLPDKIDFCKKGQLEWYELDDIDREYYCNLDSAWMTIEKVDESNYSNNQVVFEMKNIMEKVNQGNNTSENTNEPIVENTLLSNDYENLINHVENNDSITHPHVLQIISYEKGTFFQGSVIIDESGNSTNNDTVFDIKKLRINVSEALNENDTRIDSVEYDGVDIENGGAETRGKGVDVFLVEF